MKTLWYAKSTCISSDNISRRSFPGIGRGKQARVAAPLRCPFCLCKRDAELDAMMAEDMQQFSGSKQGEAANQSPGSESSQSGFKDTLDKILIADFFFILFALLWFGVGVGISAGGKGTGVLDAWYFLWQPVIQPALGVLMLGAIFSGLSKKKEA